MSSRRQREEALIAKALDDADKDQECWSLPDSKPEKNYPEHIATLAALLSHSHRREDAIRDLITLAEAPDPRYRNAGTRAIATCALKRILDGDEVKL